VAVYLVYVVLADDGDLVTIFFFFYCYGVHRDLHSFPTRRSSDLRSRVGLGALLVGYYDGGELRYAGKVGTGYTREVLFDLRDRRSEEHTSELQSRSDLVCRLLLEKKKPI